MSKKTDRKKLIPESNRGSRYKQKYDFLFDDEEEPEPPPPAKPKPLDIRNIYDPRTLQDSAHPQKREHLLSQLERISIGVVLICMSIWTIIILAIMLPMVRTPMLAVGIIGATVVYWSFVWFAYYIIWRYFWIILALNWLLATVFLMFSVGALQEWLRVFVYSNPF